MKHYRIAVRTLCEFTAKTGDLDLRFTPSPTAQEGIAGHASVTARRSEHYQREVALTGEYGPLQIRGRADGYDVDANRLEEIKTYRGDLARMPDNQRQLHWAQAKVYGHLLCSTRNLAQVTLALVYFDVGSQRETMLQQDYSAAELKRYFEQQCQLFLQWAEQEIAHRHARDAQLAQLSFPYAEFRPGQRELAAAMYTAAKRGVCLLAQAPTGIGKSVGSLFPMLKAAAQQQTDKVFFLAAKTPGRQLALDAVQVIRHSAPLLPLRTLELVARDNACVHPELACHGDSCPLARGFYDRLPAARLAALEACRPDQGQRALLDRELLQQLALAHQVCPYYLGSELARWCDVIVGDYNYYFDQSAMLYGLTQMHDWKVSVLVDEAHNMVARARKMYSAELNQSSLRRLRKIAPEALKQPLERVQRQWNQLVKGQEDDYQAYSALPEKWLAALQNAVSAIGDYQNEHPSDNQPLLQEFYFDALQFTRLAESFGPHALFDIEKPSGRSSTQRSTDHHHGSGTSTSTSSYSDSLLSIRNIVPAPYLAARFQLSTCCALFSATLSPWNYFHDLLGMPDNTAWVEVASPFAAEQLRVHVAAHISTRYQQRQQSLLPIARLMGQQYAAQRGNYLAFFSSFDYMEQAARTLAELHPDIPLWSQTRRMDEAARNEFLARYTVDSCGIGFAVLGGAFGEGVDLPGARLIGAFIATLGLPQINPVNQQIRQRMEQLFGSGTGYDYTYTYPGMQKVVQAAGRVIRTESDRGTVYLIDDRFDRPELRALLPAWWQIGPC